jgi:integrase
LKDVILLDINTGLRLGELLALEWPEVNLFQKTIFIKETKNKDSRTVPLNEAAMAILISKSKIRNIASKLVFPNPAGNIWDQCNLGKVFRNALKKARIEDFRFHDLRHTFGSRLAQAGVDINTIARLLGHRDLKMTQRYIHHTVDSLRKGVEKLNSDYILTTLSKKGVNLFIENIG